MTLGVALNGHDGGLVHIDTTAEPVPINVRLPLADRSSTEDLSDLYIYSQAGADRALARLHQHGAAARSVAFSRDGRLVASGDEDGRVRVLRGSQAAEHLREAVEAEAADGIASVAVCFLHSYTNPAHEAEAKAMAKLNHPNIVGITDLAAATAEHPPRTLARREQSVPRAAAPAKPDRS